MAEDNMSILLTKFRQLGGTIDKYYLRKDRPSKQVLVNLNGWFSGKNVREAVTKAITSQKTIKASHVGSAGSVGFK